MNFTKKELEVAAMLLELHNPVAGPGLPFSWGCKKKRRSSEDPLSPHRLFLSQTKYNSTTPIVTVSKQHVATSSPATPLSYPHSDSSNDKLKRVKTNRNISLKKRGEELRKNEVNLIQCNELLRTEIKKKKHLLNQLIESNKLWKAGKLELNNGSAVKERSQLVFDGGKSQLPTTIPSIDFSKDLLGFKPLIVANRTAMKGVLFPSPLYPHSSNNSKLGTMIKENVGTHIILDLNFCPPAHEPIESSPPPLVNSTNFQSFDYYNQSLCREMAAQARRRRLQICRGKGNK